VTVVTEDTALPQVEQLVALASTAARGWGRTTPDQRATALERIATRLDGAADELVPLAQRETHLPEARLRSELGRTTFQLRLLAEAAREGSYLDATLDSADPDWKPVARPDLRRVNLPVGPVVVFAAGNFPFAFSVAGGDTASALAVGCPVLAKAHPGHLDLSVATAEIVRSALEQAGAPAGTFALLVGDEAGRAALTHPLVRAGAFTGSLRGGRTLYDLAQSRPEPIPFYAEMGSVNPVVVTRAAAATRLPEVLGGYAVSFTLGQGQFCTKPGVLLLPREAAGEQDLVDAVSRQPGGAPLLSDAIHAGFVRVLGQLRKHPRVTVVSASESATASSPTPTLLATDAADVLCHPELLEEVFGPASLVVRYDDEDQLLAVLAALPGQLTATVQAVGDEPELPELLAALTARAGRVIVNGWPTGVAVTHAMHHGGPYPATTSSAHTSVGTGSLGRFTRPVSYQNVPDGLLPPELQDANPLRLPRRVDGELRKA
jgi:NADP-dependent aldehyde dehydrogenase